MSAYRTGSGRSRPNSWRTCATTCGVALRPAMRAAGSTPGVAKKIRKTSTLMEKRTRTAEMNRRIENESI